MTEAPEAAHAKFSASGASKWLACPGSIALAEQAPPGKDSVYALEGSRAHRCLEQFLKNPKERAKDVSALLLKSNPFDMVQHTREAAEEVWRRTPAGAEMLAETKISLDFIHPDLWGTTDVMIAEDFGRLTVIDYKHGSGLAVEVLRNPQLAFYGLGAAHRYDYNFKEIALVVIQPRAEHEHGPIREWVLSVKELRKWEETFRKGVAAALDPLAELVPGDHCRFCSCKPICPALSNKALASAQVDFRPFDPVVGSGAPASELVPLPDVRKVPLPNLPVLLDVAELLEHWIDGLRHHAANVLEAGGVVGGWKMVPKLGQRRWKNPDEASGEAKAQWGDRAFTEPELLSPAQLEKAVKDKGWVEARVTRESSGLKMVRSEDDRPGITGAQADFAGVPFAVIKGGVTPEGMQTGTPSNEVLEAAFGVKPLPSEVTHARSNVKKSRTRKDVKPRKPSRAPKPKPAKKAAAKSRRRR